jgi:hypothetical protein
MRVSARTRIAAASMAAAASILLTSCNDSNDVAGPGPVGIHADVSGEWQGQYVSNTPSLCTSLMATASFEQTGNQVRGAFKAAGCGIDGTFVGTVDGTYVTGTVGMLGCTGGGTNGRLENGALSLTISDFRKELIAGDAEVLAGGSVVFRR